MYFVIENQFRPDGIINHTSTGYQSFAAAMSAAHMEKSKMYMTKLYTKVVIAVCDDYLEYVLPPEIITTLYEAAE